MMVGPLGFVLCLVLDSIGNFGESWCQLNKDDLGSRENEVGTCFEQFGLICWTFRFHVRCRGNVGLNYRRTDHNGGLTRSWTKCCAPEIRK